MNSKEKDEYVNQTMERMTSMEPYYCNPFDNPKELKERASDLLKQLNSLGDNAQEEKESIMRQLFGTRNTSTHATAIGIASHNSHGLAFPYFVLTRSMTYPMSMSVTPSAKRENIMMLPMIAAFNPSASV